MDDIQINSLKKIGLNEYQARAYASLIGLKEATAREILEAGSVPQGRIYDILKELARKGFVEILEGSPTYYRAIDPTEVIQNLSNTYTQNLQQSMETLKNLYIESPSRYPIWTIHNEQAIEKRISTLLKSAKEEVIIFSNNVDFFRQFVKELSILQKSCNLFIIVDDVKKFRFKNLHFQEANEEFFYIMGDIIQEGIKYRNIFSIIIDGKESFDVMNIGSIRIGIMTKLPVFSYIIKRWLKHIHLLDSAI